MYKQSNQKGFSAAVLLLLVIIIGIIGFAGWYVYNSNNKAGKTLENSIKTTNPVKSTPTPSTNVISNHPQNALFDATTVKVGDKVAGMTVSEKPSNYAIYFTGQATITGHYTLDPEDNPFTGGLVCMHEIDEASLHYLPKDQTDERNVWFCFDNNDEAKNILKGDEGDVTVVIDNYEIYLRHAEVWNTATLISLQ